MFIGILIGFSLFLDQITKYLAFEYLRGNESVVIIEKWLNFTYVENRGVAFGTFSGYTIFLTILSLLISSGIIYYIYKNREKLSRFEIICYCFIICGAVGNVIDRIARGFVVDFIHTELGGLYNYPVFNFADIYIVVACFSLLIYSFRKENTNEKL